jgi:hypothetical protein
MPNGYYTICHPPYKIPGVFDLHKRGRFKERPFVTGDWDYRVIADLDGKSALFVACLVKEDNVDPDTRIPYRFRVRETLVDLDENLAFKPEALESCMPDTGMRKSLTAAYTEWRDAYVPATEDNQTDMPALEKKVRAAAADGRASHCKRIASRNQGWVMVALPRMIQDFRFGLYDLTRTQLSEQYQTRGGDADDLELMRKSTDD